MSQARQVAYGNELDMERVVTAMIVCDTVADSIAMLEAQGLRSTEAHFRYVRNTHPQRLQERRDELAPVLEGILANDLLDRARRASFITDLAMGRTQELLERGLVEDPARVARDMAQIMSQSVEKRLSLQGRPTQVVEHRDVAEIVRALQAMKVVQVVDSTAIEVTAGADGV